MEIKRAGSQPSGKGPAEWFTGNVRIDPLFDLTEPARSLGASVTFEPGARTAWHTHPLGQILIVTSGAGWTQCWGEPKQEIRPGDVIWCPAGKKHWHGATPTTAMTHIAIVEKLNGKGVDWMEHVTDEQYGSPEIIAEIATATVEAARLPRVAAEDNPVMSSAVRRRRTLARTQRQVQALEPLVQVGGAFGASARRHPIWKTAAEDQGWEFIGADAVEMDYTDLALKFKQFSQDCARHGVVPEPIKPM